MKSSLPPRLNHTLSSPQRRTLLKAFAASGLLAAVARNRALAQTSSDYKALVCLYLEGGNDGENTLMRYDSAGYQRYAGVRTPASRLNIPQAELLPVQPASLGTPFGFHPGCVEMKNLFDQKRLAVISNVGMLAAPSTRAGLQGQTIASPANLFSHSDQALALQTAGYNGLNRVGWGGRVVDKLDRFNVGTSFPALITAAGMKSFTAGNRSVPLTLPDTANFTFYASGANRQQHDAIRDAALKDILMQTRSNAYELAAQLLAEEGVAAASVVFPILNNTRSVVAPFFAGLTSGVAGQLKSVALMLEGRAQTGLRRQVFYVQQTGYDTHADQVMTHDRLLRDLSQALQAFQNAVDTLGLANNVTAFTLSDFGRTFKPATNAGTDHGWGNYAFVQGGAVNGGDFYGSLPTLQLAGPDDVSDAGRWIPTTSLEQYGATMCRWFGIGEADLPYVFPNLGAFSNTNLGFMRPS